MSTDPLLAGLLALTASWTARAAAGRIRANQLGNCAAGKDAFGDALVLESCVRDVNDLIAGQSGTTASPAQAAAAIAFAQAQGYDLPGAP